MNLYFDSTATTRVCDEAIKAMNQMMSELYGNPSSKHREGLKAEDEMNKGSQFFARLLGVDVKELFYTSGGTESNNLAVLGVAKAYQRSGKHIITSAYEHPSVGSACAHLEELGFEVTRLKPGSEGQLDLDELVDSIREDTILVSLMHVNNEVGSVLPIDKIGELIESKNSRTLFHVDGVQSFMKFPTKPKAWKVDLFSCSSHKIHGPKGAGLLYKKQGVKIVPLQFGGSQQLGVRPGTQNVPGIIGFFEAAKAYESTIESRYSHVLMLRTHLEEIMAQRLPEWTMNSVSCNGQINQEVASPYVVSYRSKGIKGEVILHALEDYGISISTGSACSSKKLNVSHVLTSIGLSDIESDKSIRISLNEEHTVEDVEFLVNSLVTIDKMFGRFIKK